jgi:SAM-dependent methyltransferase
VLDQVAGQASGAGEGVGLDRVGPAAAEVAGQVEQPGEAAGGAGELGRPASEVGQVAAGGGQPRLQVALEGQQQLAGRLVEGEQGRAVGGGDSQTGDQRRPEFLVGDVAALAFPDRSFDLVVSTLSMHHWADPATGLAEIGRVLRPGARALIWDVRPGGRPHLFGPRHAHIPDAVDHTRNARLRVVKTTAWPWPWRLTLTQRTELARHREGDRHEQS